MFKLWMKLLLSYFVLGIEGEGEPGGEGGAEGEGAEGAEGAEGEEEGAEGEQGEEGAGEGEGEGGEPPAQKQESRSARTIREQRDRAQRAEEDAARARAELDAHRRQAQGPSKAQQEWDEEERRLRAAETSEQEKWQIQANRTLRSTQQASQNALALAQDTNDKTAYESAAMTNQTLAKYRDRVETEAAKLRAQGQPVSRLALARYLIGDDVASGKYQPKAKTAAKKPAGQLPESQRNGGARARSDVPRGTANTESARRFKRLENQPI